MSSGHVLIGWVLELYRLLEWVLKATPGSIAGPIGVVVLAVGWLLLCALVAREATVYRRSPGAWFLLALLFTPFAAYVFLVVAGIPYSAVVLQEKEERVRKQHPELAEVREAALSELECPKCGATINPATRDGLHAPEDEPWTLICDRCGTEIKP